MGPIDEHTPAVVKGQVGLKASGRDCAPFGRGRTCGVQQPQQLFGRIALKKGFLDEDQLVRALRYQEEIRNLGLRKQLGEILLAVGSLTPDQVEQVLRLQALNERALYARRFGRIALKNAFIDPDQLAEAMETARAEGFQRSLATLLKDGGALDDRHARAITSAMDRVLAKNLGRSEPPERGGRATERLTQTLELEHVEEDEDVLAEARRRTRDLTFAAVALREGMILIPELERAAEEQVLRADGAPLEDVLVERGVLAREEVESVAQALELAREDRLAIPGYQVVDVRGYGATSIVLQARHEVLGREVAIKLFHADYAAAVGAESMAEEARAVAAVQHPNVVGIYEVGRVHRRVYYVMELVDGPNLAERIRDDGALTEPEVLRLARDLLEGLRAIHEHGLVHRDVKPLNVLVDAQGNAKLTDLGLVCEAGLEQPGEIHGSPLTIAPEQAQGDAVDRRADLYSLGATLYHALVGVPPFERSSGMAMMMAHITEAPLDPREQATGVSDGLAELLLHLLAKVPDERPADAGEVLRRLDALSA
jgi:tRNA A-37 threonylcarbamoyl transferase component Bud32